MDVIDGTLPFDSRHSIQVSLTWTYGRCSTLLVESGLIRNQQVAGSSPIADSNNSNKHKHLQASCILKIQLAETKVTPKSQGATCSHGVVTDALEGWDCRRGGTFSPLCEQADARDALASRHRTPR